MTKSRRTKPAPQPVPEKNSHGHDQSPGGSFTELVEALNNKFPATEKYTTAWIAGFNASKLGVIRTRNPYQRDTSDWNDWMDGWESQYYGEVLVL